MPELPEVEVLVRHLRPILCGRTIRKIEVRRPKVLRPTTVARFKKILRGAKFLGLSRRGKYLLFELRPKNSREKIRLLGHLGMTGRMFLAPHKTPPPKHAAVILDLGSSHFIYEDTRYFGRLTLDLSSVEKLGPEPLDENFTAGKFRARIETIAPAGQSQIAGPIARRRRRQHLCERGLVSCRHFAPPRREPADAGAGAKALASRSRRSGRSD